MLIDVVFSISGAVARRRHQPASIVSPLVSAAKTGHAAVVVELLGDNRTIAEFVPSKTTPLIQAAKHSRDDGVNRLIERDKVDVNKSDGRGRTALLAAVRHEHANVVKILLSRLDVEVQPEITSGETPLSSTIISRNREIVEILLANEATDINYRDNTLGITPILWAARKGKLSLAELLLRAPGVRVDVPDFEGRTPLSWAAGEGFAEIIELLSSRSDVSINTMCNLGRTPLSYAASYGAVGAIRVLLGLPGIEPGICDQDGRSALSWAAQDLQTYTGHRLGRQLISLAAAMGIMETSEGARDVSEIYPPIDHRRIDTLSLLLTSGSININEADNQDRTPLSWAAGGGRATAIQFFLSQDSINADIPDVEGHNPSWHAKNSGHQALAKVLSSNLEQFSSEEIEEVTQTTAIGFHFLLPGLTPLLRGVALSGQIAVSPGTANGNLPPHLVPNSDVPRDEGMLN